LWGNKLEEIHGISIEQQKEFFTSQEWSDIVIGKADLSEKLLPFLTKWNWHFGLDEFLEFWFKNDLQPIQKNLQIAKDLKKLGYKIIVATDQEKNRLDYLKKHLLDPKIFDEIIVSYDLGFSKKSTEFWTELKLRLNLEPTQTLVIDDGIKQLEKAKEVGFQTILFVLETSNLESELRKFNIR
jgi:HAD superfamily hydrolase (TIGR01509 family)